MARDAPAPSLFDEIWLGGRLDRHLGSVYRDVADPIVPTSGRHTAPVTYTKVALARAAGRVSRASGRGGGSAAPGRLLLQMAPTAIRALAARLPGGSTLVSATNGKTTTARMLTEILKADGQDVVHNRTGANTHWGVCTALVDQPGDRGVFEVDEAWLPLIAEQVRPRLVVLGNLFRDRLDCYGEVDQLCAIWQGLLRASFAPRAVVANADDPLIAGPGGVLHGAHARPALFGVADDCVGTPVPEHPHEGRRCLACGAALRYSRAFVGHLGHFDCSSCAASRPGPLLAAADVRENGLDGVDATIVHPGWTLPVRLGLPGLHNVYNALAASAAAWELGVGPAAIRAGLEAVEPPFGRGEVLVVGEREVRVFLAKNPVGINEVFRLLGTNRESWLHLWLALNDHRPDGRDVSWIWDADFERLAGAVDGATCSGRRAGELAVRLKYAGWRCPLYVEEDLEGSFRSALRRTPGPLVALPTYTALLGLRGVLNRLGVSVRDWGRSAQATVW